MVTFIDLMYLGANLFKIPHGGYWSLILGTIPLLTILIYTQGQKKLYRVMDFMPLEDFLLKFNRVYDTSEKIKGSVLFLIKDVKEIPFYITQTIFFHGIMYEDNILLSIVMRDDPYGITGFFKPDLAPGLRVFEIQMGYMEVIDVEEILREAGIEERVVFYGLEDITAKNLFWKSFSVIKRLTPAFIKFYQFPLRGPDGRPPRRRKHGCGAHRRPPEGGPAGPLRAAPGRSSGVSFAWSSAAWPSSARGASSPRATSPSPCARRVCR